MEGIAMNGDRDQETTEVRETNEVQGNTNVKRQTVATAQAVDSKVVLRRIVYYIAGIIIAFLAVRIVLLMLGANQGSGFVDFVYSVGGFFASPFYGIFNYQPTYGQFTFEISSVVAIIIYGLIAWGIAKLFTLTSSRTDV
jgi:type IV secretory pathway VirB2 component (pilin)